MQHFKKGDVIPKYLVEVDDDFLAVFGCDVDVVGSVIECRTGGNVINVVSKDGNTNLYEDFSITIHAHQIVGCDNGELNSGICWTAPPYAMFKNLHLL